MITIRKAIKEDCPAMMELIKELAIYEKAPNEVTVDLEHFKESGFGEKPVWWAFVAEETASPSPSGRGEYAEIAADEDATSKNLSPNTWPVALASGIIGFALYYIRYSTWKGQRMYLEDLIVTEKMRGKKVGQLLFNALIEEAKEKKLKGINWQVLDWNEPAINFYKKLPNVNFDSEWINCSINL